MFALIAMGSADTDRHGKQAHYNFWRRSPHRNARTTADSSGRSGLGACRHSQPSRYPAPIARHPPSPSPQCRPSERRRRAGRVHSRCTTASSGAPSWDEWVRRSRSRDVRRGPFRFSTRGRGMGRKGEEMARRRRRRCRRGERGRGECFPARPGPCGNSGTRPCRERKANCLAPSLCKARSTGPERFWEQDVRSWRTVDAALSRCGRRPWKFEFLDRPFMSGRSRPEDGRRDVLRGYLPMRRNLLRPLTVYALHGSRE